MPLTHDLAQFLGIKRQHAIDGVPIFLVASGIRRQPSRQTMSVVACTLGHSGAGNDDYRRPQCCSVCATALPSCWQTGSYCPGESMHATSAYKVFSWAA
jgi:hypothetical protein